MSRIDSLAEKIKHIYDNGDPAHDWAHIQRVMANCRMLVKSEGGDLETLLAAALLHDIVNLPKNHPKRKEASSLAAHAAKRYLIGDFTDDEIQKICTAVEEHSYSLGKTPSLHEAALLQDADRLDAVGAIGVMRTIATGTKMGSPFYDVEDPYACARSWVDNNMIDHFYIKTLKLGENMNTKTARDIASQRTEFMKSFLQQLKGELAGES